MDFKHGSYNKNDVTFLLKDLSDLEIEKDNQTREKLRSEGVHYASMLPIEYEPKKEYISLYEEFLDEYGLNLALEVGILANRILQDKGNVVLVSLARAGTPIGVLIKRYFEEIFDVKIPHYSVSIIRDIELDHNAMIYIKRKHPDKKIQFLDGWTGKGAITLELKKSLENMKENYGIELESSLAVISDPGHCAEIYSTREDIIIPSSFLNSTVSGLMSRTVYNKEWIGERDFHGGKLYRALLDKDRSVDFINRISKYFKKVSVEAERESKKEYSKKLTWKGMKFVEEIKNRFKIDSIHKIKPGIGETTRVLLRRVPWKIIVRDLHDKKIRHILLLAKDKSVDVLELKDIPYACCGIVKKV